MNFLMSVLFADGWVAVSECAGSNDLSSLKTETSAAAGQGERGMAASRSLAEFLADPSLVSTTPLTPQVSMCKTQFLGDLLFQSFELLKSSQLFLRTAVVTFMGKVVPPVDSSLPYSRKALLDILLQGTARTML